MHAATTARFHFANPSSAQPLHFSYPPDRRAAPPSSSASASSSSFVRAAAPRQMQPFAASASHFLPSAFRSTYPLTSSSAASASFGVGPSPMGSPYEVDVAEADLRTSAQPYSPEQYPSQPWSTVGEPSQAQAQAQSQYADPYASPPYELPPAASASPSENGAYASVKAEEPLESYAAGMYLAPYADHLVSANHPSQHQHQSQQQQHQHQQSPSFAYSLPQFHPSSSPQHQHQMAYAYNHSHSHGHGHPSQGGSAQVAASYMLAAAAAGSPGAGAHLQYPDYTPEGEAPRYVHPAQVSPAISPSSPFAQLQDASASPQMAPMSQNQSQGLDPRFTMNNALQAMGAVGVMSVGAGMGMGAGGLNGGGPSPSEDFEFDSAGSGSVSGGESPYLTHALPGASAPIPVPQPGRSTQRKRPRSVSFTSSSEDEDEDDFSNSGSGSGESEHDHDEEDDGEFVQGSSGSRAVRARRYDAEYMGSPGTSLGSASAGSRRLAPPVPVPNLTKKSRGRRVPTAQQVVSEGTMQKRGYMCKVAGCGKCFARGEHLKRHVRSIHTNEKREWFFLLLPFLR